MPDKKNENPAGSAAKDSPLTKVGFQIGRFLGKYSSTIRETSRKIKKSAEAVAESVSRKAEEMVAERSALDERPAVLSAEPPSAAPAVLPTEMPAALPESKTKSPIIFKAAQGKSVAGHLESLAEDIQVYLHKNGKTTVDKVVNAMMRRKNSRVMVLGAIGWLAHDKAIKFSPKGEALSPKEATPKS